MADHKKIFSVVGVALIVGAVWIVYGRALNAPFVFDDSVSVIDNRSIIRLWPLVGDAQHPGPLNPPKETTTSGRPLVNLSLAVNYYFGQFNPVGYHVFNLIVHVLSALLVMAIVRRTLCLEYFEGKFAICQPRAFVGRGAVVGFASAADRDGCVRHPAHGIDGRVFLFGHAVREPALLGGDFVGRSQYLAGAGDSGLFGRHGVQRSDGHCAGGRAVVRAHIHRRLVPSRFAKFMAAVCGTVFKLGVIAVSQLRGTSIRNGWISSGSAGLRLVADADQSAADVFEAGRLAVAAVDSLRDALSDGWPAHGPDVAAFALLGIVTLILLWRRKRDWLRGAWVFIILSPTLIVPIVTEVAAERRMYLPLAALVTLVVVAAYRLAQHLSSSRHWALAFTSIVALLVATVCGVVSAERLAAYQSEVTLWQDNVDHQPDDPISYNNLGLSLARMGQLPEAVQQFEKTLQLHPDHASAHSNLCCFLLQLGRTQEAIEHGQKAIAIDPNAADAHNNLGNALAARDIRRKRSSNIRRLCG